MSDDNGTSFEHKMFLSIFQQNCESLRHVRTERLLNANIYGLIVAASLSVLRSIAGGSAVAQLALITFLLVFSVLWLLTSLRLKAELEECSKRTSLMLEETKLDRFAGMGAAVEGFEKYPKLRSIFPLFYGFASVCFLLLLIYTIVVEWMAK